MRCIEVFNTFVSSDNKDHLIQAMPTPVYMKDTLMQVRRNYDDHTMPLEQAQKDLAQQGEADEEEHVLIS